MADNWIHLTSKEQLDTLRELSYQSPQLIFKHSTRCSISSVALNRMDPKKIPQPIACYYLDLLRYRELSDLIAESFQVYHESPQILLIRNGACIYEESHLGINPAELARQATAA